MPESDVKIIRAAVYARVSTEEQKEGKTIDSQVGEIERFAKDKGWSVTQIYKDDGWSGSLLTRPALDCLRDDASKGCFDAVLVNDVDRLARDVSHLGIVKRDLERKGVRLVFRKLPDEASPTHNLMVNILGSFAEFERELIIDRTRRGRRHKVETAKQYVGCVAPYGYHYETGSSRDGNTAIIRLIPEEARVVRKIFEWSLAGVSMNKIANKLTAAGVPTRTSRPKWHSSIVWKILRNETYAGVWSYGKSESCEPRTRRCHNLYRRSAKTSYRPKSYSDWFRVPLAPEFIIIEPALWKQTQERINKNRRFSPRNAKHFYLLQGLVKCGTCFARCSGTCSPGGRKLYFYYRCWRRKCEKEWTPMKLLDEAVWSTLKRAFEDPVRLAERVSKAHGELLREQAVAQPSEPPEQQKSQAEAQAFQRYRQGSISPQQLAAELQRIGDRKPMELVPPVPNAGQLEKSVAEFCEQVRECLQSGSPAVQQEVIRRLVTEVRVEPTRAKIMVQIPNPGEMRLMRTGLNLSPSPGTTDRSDVHSSSDEPFGTRLESHDSQRVSAIAPPELPVPWLPITKR